MRKLEFHPNGTISESTGKDSLTNQQGVKCWLDIEKPSEEVMSRLKDVYAFHPLAVEDCLHFDQYPKIEDYSDYIFFVSHAPHKNEANVTGLEVVELHTFLSSDYIVTIHDQPLTSIEKVWSRVRNDDSIHKRGLDFVRYLVTDAIVDDYFPYLEELNNKVDSLESRILEPSANKRLFDELLWLRKQQIALRNTLAPQRNVIGSISRIGSRFISDKTALYFRDAHDHLLRITESLAANRELLESIINAYHWSVTQRTNEVVKRLTLLSAVFLPLTFITGFFGQNFEAIPFNSKVLMTLVLTSCVVVPIGMITFFLRSKWF